MKYDKLDKVSGTPASGRYGDSRMVFRGPSCSLEDRFVAFVGGSETYGRSLAKPYPALLEARLDETCVNFAQPGASVEAFLHDPFVKDACRQADVTVVAITGAHNVSNRFYSVHPRRNDRFIKPSDALRVLYPQVDFTEINFTRHLLSCLHHADPDCFDVVKTELQLAWRARMRTFLEHIGPRVVLLWFMPEVPATEMGSSAFGPDPLFISADMVAELRHLVRDTLRVSAEGATSAEVFEDPSVHREIAGTLLQPIRAALAVSPHVPSPDEPKTSMSLA